MYENLSIQDFLGKGVLNIFCDASTNRGMCCYGAIAVTEGSYTVDELYRIETRGTNNEGEIKGIRGAVLLASKYNLEFPKINIFSDSQISIYGIRDRIFTWNNINGKLCGYNDKEIQNQSVFIEIVALIAKHSIYCTFWHQKGHVDVNSFRSIQEAAHVFKASNGIRGILDYELIKYISDMNNIVDVKTRGIIKKHNPNVFKGDAFEFGVPDTFENDMIRYRNIKKGRKYNETQTQEQTNAQRSIEDQRQQRLFFGGDTYFK